MYGHFEVKFSFLYGGMVKRVRKQLDEVVQALGYPSEGQQMNQQEVLDAVDRSELNPQEAILELKRFWVKNCKTIFNGDLYQMKNVFVKGMWLAMMLRLLVLKTVALMAMSNGDF